MSNQSQIKKKGYQGPKCCVASYGLRNNVLNESFGADNANPQLEGYSNNTTVKWL